MIRAGIAGLGWWGQSLVDSVAGNDFLRFVTATSRHPTPEIQAFARANGLQLEPNFEALLDDSQIDAVIIATPHSAHAGQVIAAATAGKHVFCEKPLALTRKDASDAIDAVRRSGVMLGLGYGRRFHPEIADLRKMIRTGELGTILHAGAMMASPGMLNIDPGHWRARENETPCGGLTPMGVHAIDSMIDLLGPVEQVFAFSGRRATPADNHDATAVLLRMEAGMSCCLGVLAATAPCARFQVFGSGGWVLLEGKPHLAGTSMKVRRESTFSSARLETVGGSGRAWQVAPFDVARAALEAFASAAEAGGPPPIPFGEIVHGVAVTDAIIRSARSGAPEHVN